MGRAPIQTETRYRLEPSPEVLAYFRNKGMQPSFDWRDVYPQEHAHAFTVAKATQMAVLRAIRQEVDHALAAGIPFEEFQARLTPRLQRLGWWGKQIVTDPETGDQVEAQLGSPHRLRIIFDANIRTANAAGQWERIQRSKAVLPYLIYQHTTSQEPREEHWEWADAPIVLPVDDPWWHTHFPPNGWQCKCWVLQADEDEAREAGWRPGTAAPDLDEVAWFNARSGETEMVPAGIDPGWQTNPGRTRQQLLDALLNNNLEDVDPAIRAVALKDITSSWLFRQIAEGKIDNRPNKLRRNPLMPEVVDALRGRFANADVAAPAGHLGPAIQGQQGWKSGVVWLDTEVAAAIRAGAGKTAGAQAALDWTLVPRVLDEGALVRHDITKDWLTAYRQIDGQWYRAEVMLRDRTPDGYALKGGARLRLESFQRIDAKTAEYALAGAGKQLLRAEAPKAANPFTQPSPPGGLEAGAGGRKPPKQPPPLPTKAATYEARIDGPVRPEDEAVEAARQLVVGQGKVTGCEWGCMVGPAGEHLATWSSGKPAFLAIDGRLLPELFKPGAEVRVHHNHPSSSSLSGADLRMLDSLPGLSTLYAHGHDGSIYRAMMAATGSGKLAATVPVVDTMVGTAIEAAVAEKLLGMGDAMYLRSHVRNQVLGRLGLIDYNATLGTIAAPATARNAGIVEALTRSVTEDAKALGLDH